MMLIVQTIIASFLFSAFAFAADPIVQVPPEGMLPKALVQLSSSTQYAFVVDKELRTLTLWKNGDTPTLVVAHPSDMGKNKGNKSYQGDHKTPEGIYFFQETFEQPNLDYNLYGNRAFTMDYPNFFDRLEKKTGSGIWLHAIPNEQTLSRGSRGCVVVRNEVIDQLKSYINLKKTPIIVQNKVEYITPKEWKENHDQHLKWLESWKTAWEAKDLTNYMSYYDDSFKALGMDWAKWKSFKENLATKYSYIKVGMDDVDIFKNNGQFIFRFNQSYQSDRTQDFGEKILYVQDRDGQLKILNESWSETKGPVLTSGSSKNPGS